MDMDTTLENDTQTFRGRTLEELLPKIRELAPQASGYPADSVRALYSSSPGNMELDSTSHPQGLGLDTLRLLAKREIKLDNLRPVVPYVLVFSGGLPYRGENLRGFGRRDGNWDSVSVSRMGNRYQIVVPPDADMVVLELAVLQHEGAGPDGPALPGVPRALVVLLREDVVER
jgi:hypothetical protein